MDLDGSPQTLVVERFDRKVDNNSITRIHQEDCAQALGVDPVRKYAAASSPKKTDPTFRRIAALLDAYAEDILLQLECLLQQMIVNVVLGNTDAHAKNFSLLHPDKETVVLAPMHDVVPAIEITPGIVNMGMRIDGRIQIDRIEIEQIKNEARAWGMSTAGIVRIINGTVSCLREGIKQANELYPIAGELPAEPAMKRLQRILGG